MESNHYGHVVLACSHVANVVLHHDVLGSLYTRTRGAPLLRANSSSAAL